MIKRPVHRRHATEFYLSGLITALLVLVLFAGSAHAGTVQVDYFYEQGCMKCNQASPVIKNVSSAYPQVNLSVHEISSSLDLADQYGVTTVPSLVINRSILIGYEDYHGDTALLEKMFSEAIETAPALKSVNTPSPGSSDSSRSNNNHNPVVIFVAGLFAGLNPCLIAVMAFLASLIISSGGSRRAMMVLVAGFCAGIFVTYTIAGLGILNAISYFPGLRETITSIMIPLIALLGIWQLYDASYIKKNSKSSFRTPRMFTDIMNKAEGKNILLVSFAGGSIFSLVKAPCVGAVYLMILEMLIEGDDPAKGAMYLALYNLGVVLPVLLLGILLVLGLDPEKVSEFREKRRVEARLITGITLLVLAVLLKFNVI